MNRKLFVYIFFKVSPLSAIFSQHFFFVVYALMERLLSPVALLLYYFIFLFLYFIFSLRFDSSQMQTKAMKLITERRERSQRYLNETLLLYFSFLISFLCCLFACYEFTLSFYCRIFPPFFIISSIVTCYFFPLL